MEFFEAVNVRRSVRRYTDEAVPEEVIQKALDAALLAPNSSNMQPWEFYWVRSAEPRKKLIEACFSQSAARTSQELIVAVSRADTWRRNCKLMLEEFAKESEPAGPNAKFDYYKKVVPALYLQDWFGILALGKKLFFGAAGFFRPVPRGPCTRAELWQMLHKTTALGCENFMLAIAAQGYATCPMEGFDQVRVKKILGLGRNASVTMVMSVGRADPSGIWGKRIRFDRNLFVKKI
jgi:nitroreductase